MSEQMKQVADTVCQYGDSLLSRPEFLRWQEWLNRQASDQVIRLRNGSVMRFTTKRRRGIMWIPKREHDRDKEQYKAMYDNWTTSAAENNKLREQIANLQRANEVLRCKLLNNQFVIRYRGVPGSIEQAKIPGDAVSYPEKDTVVVYRDGKAIGRYKNWVRVERTDAG